MKSNILVVTTFALACAACAFGQVTIGASAAGGYSPAFVGSVQVGYYPHDPAVLAYLLADVRSDGQKGVRAGCSLAVAENSHGFIRLFVEPGAAFQDRQSGFAFAGGISPQLFVPRTRLTVDPFVRAKRALGKTALEVGMGLNVILSR
jgi:hypothetical protein